MAAPSDANSAISPPPNKYRGATVEDLDPPAALSTSPQASISSALLTAYERDYTHLTVVDPTTKTLQGYIGVPALRAKLESGDVAADDTVATAMVRFPRRRQGATRARRYRVITMATPLGELEEFFNGVGVGGAEGTERPDFAVVTDPARRFVLGVATRADLEEFVRRRPV